MFVDTVEFEALGGRGGDGLSSFRREKDAPRGGPSGGNGGRGGSIVFTAVTGRSTLADLAGVRKLEADPGGRGGPSRRAGAAGDDRVVEVPLGTVVRDLETGDVLADLVRPGDRVVAARGGRGGRGNAVFATPTHRAPRERERGAIGERRRVGLEVRLIADVGLVGLPNAGKSTLLASLSRARPKIADYPFTTTEPVLGVVAGDAPFVVADLPGLIEGAARGRGLGIRFLRHVERTRLLLYVLDLSSDPLADLSTVEREVAVYSKALAARDRRALLTKADLVSASRARAAAAALAERGIECIGAVSAPTRKGLAAAAGRLAASVAALPPSAPLPRTASYRYASPFRVLREEDGCWRIAGERLERRAAIADPESVDSLRRLWRLLERLGAADALRAAGAQSGDVIRIGEDEFAYEPDGPER